ncbi:MAG: TIGR00730 family Rossman fold protein [Rubrimonas sp.]
MRIESVCVYCGSRHGDDPAFTAEARALGRGLAQRGLRLVYGAGDVGLMGEVARAAMGAGGKAVGVIPKHLLAMEVGYRDLTAMIVTDTMHERTKIMFANAEATVVLPGGPGTLDEMFEVLTWRQLGLHANPLFLVNVRGYWDPFLALVDHAIARGFAQASFRDFITITDGAEQTLAAIAALNE